MSVGYFRACMLKFFQSEHLVVVATVQTVFNLDITIQVACANHVLRIGTLAMLAVHIATPAVNIKGISDHIVRRG